MQYFRMARRAVAEGRLAWLVATAAKAASVPVSHRLGRPLAGPLMANLVPTYRCNNACFMCDLPKPSLYEGRGEREFDTNELKAIIDDMATIGVAGLSLAGASRRSAPTASSCWPMGADGVSSFTSTLTATTCLRDPTASTRSWPPASTP